MVDSGGFETDGLLWLGCLLLERLGRKPGGVGGGPVEAERLGGGRLNLFQSLHIFSAAVEQVGREGLAGSDTPASLQSFFPLGRLSTIGPKHLPPDVVRLLEVGGQFGSGGEAGGRLDLPVVALKLPAAGQRPDDLLGRLRRQPASAVKPLAGSVAVHPALGEPAEGRVEFLPFGKPAGRLRPHPLLPAAHPASRLSGPGMVGIIAESSIEQLHRRADLLLKRRGRHCFGGPPARPLGLGTGGRDRLGKRASGAVSAGGQKIVP